MSTYLDIDKYLVTDWMPYRPGDPIVELIGMDSEGKEVLITVDPRPGLRILDILRDMGELHVEVEPWAVQRK